MVGRISFIVGRRAMIREWLARMFEPRPFKPDSYELQLHCSDGLTETLSFPTEAEAEAAGRDAVGANVGAYTVTGYSVRPWFALAHMGIGNLARRGL